MSLPRIFPITSETESGDDLENHREHEDDYEDSLTVSDRDDEETEEEEGGTVGAAAPTKIIISTQPMKTIHGSLVESLPEVLPPELEDISRMSISFIFDFLLALLDYKLIILKTQSTRSDTNWREEL